MAGDPSKFSAGQTVTMQGKGGAVFDVTVPRDGSNQREVFDLAVRDEELVEVETKPARKAAAPKADTED